MKMNSLKSLTATLSLASMLFYSGAYSKAPHKIQLKTQGRSIASIEETEKEIKEETKKETKKSKVQDELKLSIQEKIEQKEKRIKELKELVASYEKEQTDENILNKCEEEIKKAKEEIASLESELQELVALNESEVIVGKKEDDGICSKEILALSPLLQELLRQQNLVSQIYMYTTSLMLTNNLQQYYLDTFTPKYDKIGEQGIAFSSIMGTGFDPNSFYYNSQTTESSPNVYIINNIQEQMQPNKLMQPYNFSPSSVSDVSRNPMYAPQFGQFSDMSPVNHNFLLEQQTNPAYLNQQYQFTQPAGVDVSQNPMYVPQFGQFNNTASLNKNFF